MSNLRQHNLYDLWHTMRQRCENPKATGYSYYGGRGIKVCERWLSFKNFLEDMGERPSLKHTLDRIDVNGNYEPSNCRWVTWTEQANNRRMTSRNQSGVTGVSWHKSANKWEASITVNYKKIYLGVFNTIEEAIKAREERVKLCPA